MSIQDINSFGGYIKDLSRITVVVFWLAFFGLDVSQNCWIYPPSWNEILIYMAVVLKGVPQDLYYNWHCNQFYNIVVCNPLVCHSYNWCNAALKLVSAIFYQIFIFSSNDSPYKTIISSKKLFPFSRYLNFCVFSLPFHTFQIQKFKWKWNNL